MNNNENQEALGISQWLSNLEMDDMASIEASRQAEVDGMRSLPSPLSPIVDNRWEDLLDVFQALSGADGEDFFYASGAALRATGLTPRASQMRLRR